MQSQPPNYQQQQPMDPNAPRGAAQAYYGNPPQTEGYVVKARPGDKTRGTKGIPSAYGPCRYYGEQSHGAKGMAQQQQPPLHPIPNQSGGGMQQQGSYPPGPPANCS
ncbi:hypothetical protein QFC22_001004 [Naganishia vaughanmartiniae]|uniref:Uncharacterized protein n=1 Tax=Naganishia vaughanmartiniae TaxID=1424756 RepID=A0ACC2XKN4_9TREE|nr:hypothetical protein QFC22_001004 [Naganishia vaughanmartiniae]